MPGRRWTLHMNINALLYPQHVWYHLISRHERRKIQRIDLQAVDRQCAEVNIAISSSDDNNTTPQKATLITMKTTSPCTRETHEKHRTKGRTRASHWTDAGDQRCILLFNHSGHMHVFAHDVPRNQRGFRVKTSKGWDFGGEEHPHKQSSKLQSE